VAYAGYLKNKLEGVVVCIATGHGLKDMYGLA
jgi:threonine synthase